MVSKSYPTDSSSEFDRLIHSPEAQESRIKTLEGMNHKTQEKTFPDTKSVTVWAWKWVLVVLTPSEKQAAIKELPKDVQGVIASYPQYTQDILDGKTVEISKSTGAGDVRMSVSRYGIDVLDCTRDC